MVAAAEAQQILHAAELLCPADAVTRAGFGIGASAEGLIRIGGALRTTISPAHDLPGRQKP